MLRDLACGYGAAELGGGRWMALEEMECGPAPVLLLVGRAMASLLEGGWMMGWCVRWWMRLSEVLGLQE